MKHATFILLGLAAMVGMVFYLAHLGEPRLLDYETKTEPERRPTPISVMISDDKEAWIQEAVNEFGRARPDIDIDIHVMSTMDGLNAILARRITPTVWSPSESMAIDYLRYRWDDEFGTKLFELEGEDKPQSLARSPLVWMSWRDRIEALQAALDQKRVEPDQLWAEVACAGVEYDADKDRDPSPQNWIDARPFAGLTGIPSNPHNKPMSEWGEIKFAHSDPTRSSAGLATIYLMAYGFPARKPVLTNPAVPLQAADPANPSGPPRAGLDDLRLRDQPFMTWFRRCQRLRRNFLASLQTLTHRISQFRAKDYDIVVTYENLALETLTKSKSNGSEQPYVFYPPVTAWADHPIAILNSVEIKADQRNAARELIAFLRAPERQRMLVKYGLRPYEPGLLRSLSRDKGDLDDQSIKADKNLFVAGARFNARIAPEPGTVVRAPNGEVIDRLLLLWRRATGYY